MGDADATEVRAAVHRLEEGSVQDIDRVGIDRVRKDMHVVPGACDQESIAVHLRPRAAAVVRSIQAARVVIGFHDCPHASRFSGRGGYADLAHRFGQAFFEALPGLAAVRGTPDAAALAARAQVPGGALVVPERGEEDARIARVDGKIDGSGGRVQRFEGSPPGLAAVRRFVDAGLVAREVCVALRCDPESVRIERMDADLADLTDIFEPDVRPVLAGVGRTVDAVAL